MLSLSLSLSLVAGEWRPKGAGYARGLFSKTWRYPSVNTVLWVYGRYQYLPSEIIKWKESSHYHVGRRGLRKSVTVSLTSLLMSGSNNICIIAHSKTNASQTTYSTIGSLL
jgi:hypothetical protein